MLKESIGKNEVLNAEHRGFSNSEQEEPGVTGSKKYCPIENRK
jgi:hypothetical protein